MQQETWHQPTTRPEPFHTGQGHWRSVNYTRQETVMHLPITVQQSDHLLALPALSAHLSPHRQPPLCYVGGIFSKDEGGRLPEEEEEEEDLSFPRGVWHRFVVRRHGTVQQSNHLLALSKLCPPVISRVCLMASVCRELRHGTGQQSNHLLALSKLCPSVISCSCLTSCCETSRNRSAKQSPARSLQALPTCHFLSVFDGPSEKTWP